MVDFENGKESTTHVEVLDYKGSFSSVSNGMTVSYVKLMPVTGR